VVAATAGSTARSIAAEHRTAIALLPTGSAVRLGEIPWPIARLARGNRLGGRAAIWPATTVAVLGVLEELAAPAELVTVGVWGVLEVLEELAAPEEPVTAAVLGVLEVVEELAAPEALGVPAEPVTAVALVERTV
jgi:hypothetical protein